MEAHKRMMLMEEEKQKKKAADKMSAEYNTKYDGIISYTRWKNAGRPHHHDGRPKLDGKKYNAKSILRALLPVIKEKKPISSFNSVKKAVDRLLEIEEGWEAIMEKFAKDFDEANRIRRSELQVKSGKLQVSSGRLF